MKVIILIFWNFKSKLCYIKAVIFFLISSQNYVMSALSEFSENSYYLLQFIYTPDQSVSLWYSKLRLRLGNPYPISVSSNFSSQKLDLFGSPQP